jgi:hypothetical protein
MAVISGDHLTFRDGPLIDQQDVMASAFQDFAGRAHLHTGNTETQFEGTGHCRPCFWLQNDQRFSSLRALQRMTSLRQANRQLKKFE